MKKVGRSKTMIMKKEKDEIKTQQIIVNTGKEKRGRRKSESVTKMKKESLLIGSSSCNFLTTYVDSDYFKDCFIIGAAMAYGISLQLKLKVKNDCDLSEGYEKSEKQEKKLRKKKKEKEIIENDPKVYIVGIINSSIRELTQRSVVTCKGMLQYGILSLEQYEEDMHILYCNSLLNDLKEKGNIIDIRNSSNPNRFVRSDLISFNGKQENDIITIGHLVSNYLISQLLTNSENIDSIWGLELNSIGHLKSEFITEDIESIDFSEFGGYLSRQSNSSSNAPSDLSFDTSDFENEEDSQGQVNSSERSEDESLDQSTFIHSFPQNQIHMEQTEKTISI